MTSKVSISKKDLSILLSHLPLETTECRGYKCREGHCESCNTEDYARETVEKNRQFFYKIDMLLKSVVMLQLDVEEGELLYDKFLGDLGIKKLPSTPRTTTLCKFGTLKGDRLVIAMMKEYLEAIGETKIEKLLK